MNCVDPIDHQPYRDLEKQTLRGAYAKALKGNRALRKAAKGGVRR